MRKEPTEAERKLWKVLRHRQLAYAKFRRQVPVGGYIADFLSYEHRLIVEADGGQHSESTHDAVRDRWFEDNGFRTLRFWNADILENTEGVLTAIADALATPPHPPTASRRAPPSPARGEGLR